MSELTPPGALHLVVNQGPDSEQFYEQLIGLGLSAQLIDASAGLNGIEQALSSSGLEAVTNSLHIYSHGRDGLLDLGRDQVTLNTARGLQDSFRRIGDLLASGADLYLYGCDLASSSRGKHLVDQISDLSGLDVAASDDLTGKGGDWQLEYQHGLISTSDHDLLTGLRWDGSLSAQKSKTTLIFPLTSTALR
jgi:hypothetical protein